MSLSRRAARAIVLVLLGVGPAAHASHEERCHTRDRECVIESAHTYLDALADNGLAEHVRLAPGAWRAGEGGFTDEEGIRDDLRTFECTNVAAIEQLRWYVDEEFGEGVVFYTVLADPTRGENCDPPTLPRESWIPAWLAERFRVLDGLIYEIQLAIFISAPGSKCIVPERRDADFGPAGCGDTSRACVIETGNAYLDALVTQDGTDVPLAPDAWQLENCTLRGDGGEVIRAGFASPENSLNVAIEHRRWYVDGENGVVYYTLWTHDQGDPNAPRSEWRPNYVARRFRVDDGLIKEIEAVHFIPGDPGAEPHYPDDDGDGYQFMEDNCPNRANPGQEDSGGLASEEPDGLGDACQCGDVTGNGIVNGQDGVAMTRHGLGIDPNPLFQVPGNCDVNGNGLCNGQDGFFTTRAALGLGPNGRLFGPYCPNFDPSAPCQYCP